MKNCLLIGVVFALGLLFGAGFQWQHDRPSPRLSGAFIRSGIEPGDVQLLMLSADDDATYFMGPRTTAFGLCCEGMMWNARKDGSCSVADKPR